MIWCIPSLNIRPTAKRKVRRPNPRTIEIHTDSSRHSSGIWRVAELSFDIASETNVISQRLVKNVLEKPITQLEKEDREWAIAQNDCESSVGGFVDLVWCFERSPRRLHGPTRFLVSETYDPPYDAVLGRRDTVECGIAKGKDCG
ncbi:uncharacterized protein BDR25DRAFT_301083 [Lindgomyces ingoldianus]|uniref:Uncharacterized protein n=1 Tax=Lindgomyces ingoldianus TaxID=673940 RepID=A0ACB6RA35_9PLEO|nr:uncharacterized protein BDR25DRAFT_301083 [Lindgomyces ingoldianus]KAF2475392.1 hypothetical protein BDR25DRAFT_301083 [Lindgomyces ingoldianus]